MLDVRQRTGYLFLVVTLGHILLISAQVQSQSGGRLLETAIFSAFSEVQRGTGGLIGSVRNIWSRYVALRGLRAENESLRDQLAEVQVKLQQEHALAQRTARLQQLLDLRSRVVLPTLAAEVIGGDASPGLHTVTINKGEADGVRANFAVISPQGVVGRVLDRPAARAARVQLLISRNAGAGVMIERSRAGGVVVGGGEDPPLLMEYVSNLADVKVGDLVVTAGTDGIYPKGYPVGRVESVERGAGLYRRISVRPVVDFSSIEEVLVVMASPAPEGLPAGSPEPRR
ncbi:MAG: rod shape-determining protein MreC [Acidobacteria bacterium]|nr:rod shape-determining protein MreC [Acidobacteriota bacterium]